MGDRGPKKTYPSQLNMRVSWEFLQLLDRVSLGGETRSQCLRRLVLLEAKRIAKKPGSAQ